MDQRKREAKGQDAPKPRIRLAAPEVIAKRYALRFGFAALVGITAVVTGFLTDNGMLGLGPEMQAPMAIGLVLLAWVVVVVVVVVRAVRHM